MLRDTLAEDVTKLSNLLQRDLSYWLTEPSDGQSDIQAKVKYLLTKIPLSTPRRS
jgi:hypothetical protein